MILRERWERVAAVIGLAVAGAAPALASDPPVSIINPATGAIETVDAAWIDGQYDVRHVVNPGGGAPLQVSLVTQNALADRRPRLASSPQGKTWVTWWRDQAVDAVFYALRDPQTGGFSGEIPLSAPGESSRNPVVTHDGSHPWVGYEADAPGGRTIYVMSGGDAPAPFPDRCIVGFSAYTGDLELTLESASGALWTSWVDSSSALAWSEYDAASQAWSTPGYEPSTDGRDAARARIRLQVLGN